MSQCNYKQELLYLDIGLGSVFDIVPVGGASGIAGCRVGCLVAGIPIFCGSWGSSTGIGIFLTYTKCACCSILLFGQ